MRANTPQGISVDADWFRHVNAGFFIFLETIMKLKPLLASMLIAGLWTAGNAAAIITLDNSGATSVQQQNATPCIFGGNNCNNPLGFGFTDVSSFDNDGTVTLLEGLSTFYTVSQISSLLGSSLFSVGIDTNQSSGGAEPRQLLHSFEMLVGGISTQSYFGPTYINIGANGTGWSDAMLNGFSLEGLAGATTIQFRTHYSNATNGTDAMFLASAIPEPETYAMMMAGLGLMGWVTRRRKLSAA